MEGFFAIKCRNCGGPMYSHQQTRSFDCAYCGTSTPWAEGGSEPTPAAGIRHQPLQVVDGLLKLTHVSQLEPARDSDWSYYKPYWRNMSLFERLLWEDPATANEFQNAEHVSVPCPFCGAAFEGKSTQSVFECPSCGNKIGVADLLKPGTFSKRLSMGTGAEYIPEQALPCRISAQQARANALALVHQHPNAFAAHDVDKAIEEQMALTYVPVELADLRMMASFPGKMPGKESQVYFEVLDWAWPKTYFVDIPLMGLLEPWDFSAVAPFDPAMQEGDFRVIAVEGLLKKSAVIDKLTYSLAGNDAEKAFGYSKKSMRQWARNVRKHASGLMLVPVYYVDRPASDGRDGEQVRIAVNGQTGRAAAVVFSEKKEIHVQAPLNPGLHLSAESTVHATPIEVKYAKSPFLYKIVRIGGNEGAVQTATAGEASYREEKPRRKGLLSRLFGD